MPFNGNKQFDVVEDARPGRSVFDLGYEKMLTCDFGELIPVLCEEMVPGDVFKLSQRFLLRMSPLVAPMMSPVDLTCYTYFVPYRLLWPKPDYTNNPPVLESGNWEDFITGGVAGTNAYTIPTWTAATFSVGSLWDYFGFPTSVAIPAGSEPMAFQKRAYNLVFNEYFRDENLVTAVDLDATDVLYSAWEKDYFTSALPFQQRGTAPALPVVVTGTTSAQWAADIGYDVAYREGGVNRVMNASWDSGASPAIIGLTPVGAADPSTGKLRVTIDDADLDNNTVSATGLTASTFDISDLRLAAQIQRFMERAARGGVRYTEFLQSMFSVSPSDSRLQRPEYVGGIRMPVIISEVLQTSNNDTQETPQGNMAGHGITVDKQYVGSYRAEEFGLMISIMRVKPRTQYTQGINRQWMRRTRYDFYNPLFAHLSEQAIENLEIFTGTNNTTNHGVFGYTGIYNEMRYKPSIICGEFRSTYAYWHTARVFSSLPSLNSAFVQMSAAENAGPGGLKRIFAEQSTDALWISVGNDLTGIRPMPFMPTPGVMGV